MDHFHRSDEYEEDNYLHLKDQVRRLTAIVREYQRRYLPINEDVIEVGPVEPWLTDPSMLPPLLIEYDKTIKSLREEIQCYQEDFDKLKGQSKEIVDENSRLHQELRQAIQNQLNTMQQSGGLSDYTELQIKQLQKQVESINEEKNRALVHLEETNKQCDILKAEMKGKTQNIHSLTVELAVIQDDLTKARSFAEGLQNVNVGLKADNERLLKAADTQDNEYDELKMENRRLITEVKTQKSIVNDLQDELNRLKEQLKILDKNATKKALTESTVEGTLKKLQNENLELESRVASYSKEVTKLRFEKEDFEDQLGLLQRKNASLEENEYQAIIRVRDSVQLVENALLEKEQAVIQNRQKTHEVTRLQESLTKMTKNLEEQKRKEISGIREQSRKQINQLIEDLHFYEMENGEKQTLIEKIQREKLSLEKELEKMYDERPTEIKEAGYTLDEIQKRLSKIELSRDEALLQIDTLQGTLSRNKTKWENDKVVLLNQINEYKKQIKSLKEDLTETSESRISLLEKVNSLKKEILAKREDQAALDMSCFSQVSALTQKLEQKERECEKRIYATESSNKDAMNELREMLSVQQKNNAKWREESRILCQKFETAMKALKQENNSLKGRNGELLRDLQESQRKAEEIEKDYISNKVALEKLQRLYIESDEKAETASVQVQMLLTREKQLLQDRKSLNREVDKLRLDMSRRNRQSTDQQWTQYLSNFGKE